MEIWFAMLAVLLVIGVVLDVQAVRRGRRLRMSRTAIQHKRWEYAEQFGPHVRSGHHVLGVGAVKGGDHVDRGGSFG